MDDEWVFPDFPVILGQGSAHSVSDDPGGRVFGKAGARIRVRLKNRPMGFHLPPKTPRR